MTVTLDLPPQVEQAYVAAAQARGVPVEAVVREVVIAGKPAPTQTGTRSLNNIFEQGLGLFGSPEDSALLDEVVSLAYEERRRPSKEQVPL